MSYLSQDLLAQDPDFQSRVRACGIQQAEGNYLASSDGADAAYARAIVRQDAPETLALFTIASQSPGLGEKVDNGDGTIDSSKVSDAEILASVQAFWHDVASCFFGADGTPL